MANLQEMDRPEMMDMLEELGHAAADAQVGEATLPVMFDPR